MPAFRPLLLRTRRLILLLLLTGVFFAIPLGALANVELVSFVGYQENTWARLNWETATELNNSGFVILRNETGGNDPTQYTQIPIVDILDGETKTFIEARGDSILGAVYEVYDQNVSSNIYYYLLQSVDADNSSEFHGPVPVTVTLTATVTPVASLTPTPTPTPSPTATPSPTPTPTASGTVTPAGSATVTSTPTQTRTPTLTPTRTSTTPPTFPPFNTVTPTRTETPTPGPSSTPTITPTITPSPTVTLHPLDLTLTAVLAQVTPLPTYTPLPPTRTPFPTWTPEPLPTATTLEPGFLDGASSTGIRGLILSGVFLVGGGGMFTLVYFLARKREKTSQ